MKSLFSPLNVKPTPLRTNKRPLSCESLEARYAMSWDGGEGFTTVVDYQIPKVGGALVTVQTATLGDLAPGDEVRVRASLSVGPRPPGPTTLTVGRNSQSGLISLSGGGSGERAFIAAGNTEQVSFRASNYDIDDFANLRIDVRRQPDLEALSLVNRSDGGGVAFEVTSRRNFLPRDVSVAIFWANDRGDLLREAWRGTLNRGTRQNQTAHFSLLWSWLSPAPEGAVKLVGVVDANRQLSEPNESNQRAELNLPDLIGFRFNYRVPRDGTGDQNGPIPVGTEFNVATTIWNRGAGAAGPFVVKMYASTDNRIDPATDFFVADLGTVSGLAAGATRDINAKATLPLSLPRSYFGTIHLGIVIDSPNRVGEVNESNNWGQRLNGDFLPALLYDPIPARELWLRGNGQPLEFASRADAYAFLQARGYENFTFDNTASRSLLLGPTYSRYNGRTMPAGAFRIEAYPKASKTNPGKWNIERQINEPSPRVTDTAWGAQYSYVLDWHRRF